MTLTNIKSISLIIPRQIRHIIIHIKTDTEKTVSEIQSAVVAVLSVASQDEHASKDVLLRECLAENIEKRICVHLLYQGKYMISLLHSVVKLF